MSKILNRIIEMDEIEYREEMYRNIQKKKKKVKLCNKNKNALLVLCTRDPKKALSFCEINSEIYLSKNEIELYSKNLYVYLVALLHLRESEKLLNAFKEAIKFVVENDHFNYGIDYLDIIEAAFEQSIVSDDDYFKFAKYIVNFYLSFNKYGLAIDLMCESAFKFSLVGAYQPAYRLIADAQEIAQENDLIKKTAKILFTQGSICLAEGDYEAAENDFRNALKLIEILDVDKKVMLLLNFATLMIRTERHDEASDLYQKIKNDYKNHINNITKYTIGINLSICQRELGQITEACKSIENIIESIAMVEDVEAKIEVYLVACKTYIVDNNHKIALKYANIAVNLIDKQLFSISRLHYRRGIREKYVSRINQIIIDTVKYADTDEIIDLLIFSKMNSFSDWLSILDWCQEVKCDSRVHPEVKEDISNKLEDLINFGTPILYGFREKYDDPFGDIENTEIPFPEEINYSVAWRKFNLSMIKIVNTTEHDKPYRYSTIEYIRNLILSKLNENKSYIFILVHNRSINFINLNNNKIHVAKSDIHIYTEYLLVLRNYQLKEATFGEFTSALQHCVRKLSKDFNQIINKVVDISSNEVIVIPDKLVYMAPILPVFMQHENFREMLGQREIKFKYCPILYKSQKSVKEFKQGIGIITPANNLPLLDEEMLIPMKHLNESWKIIDLSVSKINYKDEKVRNTNIIHIASHGFPISKFTDPIFSSIAGNFSSNTISTEEIQSNFWKLNYGLVITNACDSSDISFRNYQKYFKTNEIISYSSLFMLNRKSSSITVNWPIKDILSYIFSYIFYEMLVQGSDYQSAYNLTLVRIFDLTKEEVLQIISSIKDESKRKEKQELFNHSNNKYLLRDPYCYGSFVFTSLL